MSRVFQYARSLVFFCLDIFNLSVSKDLILYDASFVCHNLHCSTNALQVIVTEHKNTSKITSFSIRDSMFMIEDEYNFIGMAMSRNWERFMAMLIV